MADLQVKTANICNITSSTLLRPNAGGSGTYIADNSISVHMTNQHRASGIYISSLPEQSVIGDKYTISFVPVCATNNVMLVVLYGATTQISFTSGNRYTLTITATAADNTMAFYGGDTVEKTVIIKDIQIEKGENATPYRPYSATGWLHSLRKLGTSTDTITTLPADLYADGNNATVGISGNTVQNGTPTPTNPIQPSECGERTENLWDGAIGLDNTQILQSDGTTITSPNYALSDYIPVSASTSYVYSFRHNQYEPNRTSFTVSFYKSDKQLVQRIALQNINDEGIITIPFTTPADTKYVRINWKKPYDDMPMLNLGETALPYEPYGYKIPISSASTTTPVYLGEVESTRKIKKLIFTGGVDENWGEQYVGENRHLFRIKPNPKHIKTMDEKCSHFLYGATSSTTETVTFDVAETGWFRFRPDNASNVSLSDWKTWLQQQYAAGMPVTIWYVLETPTTGIVNEPIRKIGEYADTVSGITIPTTAGANSFDVLTTLKPSEVSLAYTGWHDATVEEWDGSQWQ